MQVSKFAAFNGQVVYFSHRSQSFVFPVNEWGVFILEELHKGTPLLSLASDISAETNIDSDRVRSDIEKLVGCSVVNGVDQQVAKYSNAHLFESAKKRNALQCRYSGVREINDIQVTIGFNSSADLIKYQTIIGQTLKPSDISNSCDVLIEKFASGYQVRTAGGIVDEALEFGLACLFGFNTAEDIAAKCVDSLFLAHAGAVVHKDSDRAAIFPGLGHAGKSTLSMSLALDNYLLVNDDVVPILPNGNMYALAQTVKLRKGSWDLFGSKLSRISVSDIIINGPDSVKIYHLDSEMAVRNKVFRKHEYSCQYLIVPEFNATKHPRVKKITPAEALGALVNAGTIFRKPASKRELQLIVDWVSSLETIAIRYNSIDKGVDQVSKIFEGTSQ